MGVAWRNAVLVLACAAGAISIAADGGRQASPPAQAGAAQAPGGPPARPAWSEALGLEIKANDRFDRNGDGWLNLDERKAARAAVLQELAARPALPPHIAGGEPVKSGARMSPASVRTYPNAAAFDPDAVRTFFIDFEESDWEKALEDFRFTDVDIPARVTIDGQVFRDAGIRYRGASSFIFIAPGRKRSLNVKLDFVHKDQKFAGYRTFNLLNSNGDATMVKALLYYDIARQYMPAPKANYAKVVINGEYWGVYVNTQQEDKDFINDWWRTTAGSRWKAPGSPWGQATLSYIGEDINEYRKFYEIKSKDDPKAWAALINLTKVLTETPLDRLEQALAPVFNVDGALRFLALENVFINDDGYWIRASDYNLYLDPSGKFHIYPHDGNEAFFDVPPAVRGKAARGTELDPFINMDQPQKVLISRLLAVPSLRTRYLQYIKEMTTTWLNWDRLGPMARRYHALIDADVQRDTRKLESYEHFKAMLEEDRELMWTRGPVLRIGLKNFVDQRRAFLLNHPEIKALK